MIFEEYCYKITSRFKNICTENKFFKAEIRNVLRCIKELHYGEVTKWKSMNSPGTAVIL